MTFEITFGNVAGGNDLRYIYDSSWPAGSDDPGPSYAIWQALSSGSPTTALTADSQIIGRVSGALYRSIIRLTLPDKPYNDDLTIEDCLIRMKWTSPLGTPPSIAVYEMPNTLDVTNVSWHYVSVSGTAYWTPSHTGAHEGSNNLAYLYDLDGNFFDNELKGIGTVLGSKLFNITDGSSGTITTVDSNVKVSLSGGLGGGTDNDFDTNDAYVISGGGSFNVSNDYGFGPNGMVDVVAPAGASDYTNISLKNYFKNKEPEWGQSLCFMLKAHNEAILGVNDAVRHIAASGGSVAYPQNILKYDDPTPNTPLIEVTPQSDGINANITFTEGYTKDDDLQSYVAVFKQAADPIYHASGVSSATYGVTLTDVGKDLFLTSDLTSDGSNSYLKTDNTEYRLQFYAQDNNNTGSSTLAVPGNLVSITRPGINASSAVDDTSPAVGQEITLTVTATGGMFGGKCKKFGVNWDSAASDTDDDYSFVELDTAATSTTIKHRYSTGGAKVIKIQVEDELGWRSDRDALSSQPTVDTPSPVAVPKLSRTEVMNTDFNDMAASFYVTGQHSYPVGSNRSIAQYKYLTTDTSNFITSFALNNDNSRFEDSSKQLQLKSSLASCADTTLKVYGLVSKSWDGSSIGDVIDTDNLFSHYEWAVVELEPGDGVEAFGTASSEFFKRIDMVALKDLDSVDVFGNVGSRYTLCTHSGTAADDNLIVNAQIRGTKLSYTWGGSAVANPDAAQTGASVDAQNITVAVTSTYIITDTGDADFLTEGFAPGDYVIITGHDQSGNNGTFRIRNEYDAVTETVIKIEGTPLTNDGSSTCKIIKDTSHLTSISCASDDVHSNTIKHLVRDDADQESSQVETSTINFRSDSNQYWDMDADASNGHIAILKTTLTRSGGISGNMALGDKRYPVGVIQTKLGIPTYSMSIRTLSQTGYIKLWSLLEGDRYGWATVDASKVGTPFSAYKQLRIRCTGGNIQQDPANAGQYIGNLQFIVLGEYAGG